MPGRKPKAKALAALRARRNGLSAVSRTEEYEAKEEDVYEKLDENEYQELVDRRREREDFVVDDGEFIYSIPMSLSIDFDSLLTAFIDDDGTDGLGYHDDGEDTQRSKRETNSEQKRGTIYLRVSLHMKRSHLDHRLSPLNVFVAELQPIGLRSYLRCQG